jgi:hypothetical protein
MHEAMGNAEPDKVKRCRERLHIRQVATAHEALEKLKTRQWAMVRLDYAGLDAGEEMTLERKVANLARRLQSRFQNHWLSREPKVTALALMVYDRYLPDQLIEEWERLKKSKADVDLQTLYAARQHSLKSRTNVRICQVHVS